MAVSNVRMPDEVYWRLKQWARAENRSINDLMVAVLDRESRRWVARGALGEARRVREEIRDRYGDFPDSAGELHRLRDERSGDE